jgi:hypothetical protein
MAAPGAGDTFTIAQILAAQSAGLEGTRRLDPEAFLKRHPDQSDRVPQKTEYLMTIPEGSSVEIYTSETLASGLEELIAKQQGDLPGLAIDRKPLPPTADQVRYPSIFVLDPFLVTALPYEPRPVIKHQLGQPFPYSLPQMVAASLLGRLEAAPVQVLGILTGLEEEGRRVVALAIRASA